MTSTLVTSTRTQAFIDGQFDDAASGQTVDCLSPATGEVLAAISACDAADV